MPAPYFVAGRSHHLIAHEAVKLLNVVCRLRELLDAEWILALFALWNFYQLSAGIVSCDVKPAHVDCGAGASIEAVVKARLQHQRLDFVVRFLGKFKQVSAVDYLSHATPTAL